MLSISNLALPGLIALWRPFPAALAIMLVLAASALSLFQLRFDDNLYRSFSSGDGPSAIYARFLEDLPFTPRQIIALIEAPGPFEVRDYERLREMALDFELVEGVESVISPASLRFPDWYSDDPGAPVLPFVLDRSDVEARLSAFEALPVPVRSLVSQDRTSAIALISIAPDVPGERLNGLLAEFEETASEPGQRLTVSFTGDMLLGPEIVSALKRDLVVFNLVGALLALVLAVLLFRNAGLVLLAVAPAVAAALAAIGIFVLLAIPMTVVSNVVPILVLVLGLADSVHLTLHLRDTARAGTPRARAEHSVRAVGPACALTAITTAAAFGAISLSSNEQLDELALVGALSVLAGFAVVIVLFALMAPLVAGSGRGIGRPTKQGRWLAAAIRVLRHGRAILAACLVVTAIASAASLSLRPWFTLDENLPTTSEARRAHNKVAEEFGGYFQLWLELSTQNERGFRDPEEWQRLTDLTTEIAQAAPDYAVASLPTLAAWLGEPGRYPAETALEAFAPSFSRLLGDDGGTTARLIVQAPEPMMSERALALHDRIVAVARANGVETITGIPVLLRHEPGDIVVELAGGLAMACLIATGLVALFYRWPTLAPLLLLPNVLPLLVTATMLHLLNEGRLSPTAMLALTVAFGVAVDDSIHFVNRYLIERRRTESVARALASATLGAGRAMVFTTLLICAGLSVTIASAFETVRLFGAMTIVTFLAALVADLMLLPVLLRKWAGMRLWNHG